jgi:trimethylamine corrinoid protein
MSQPIFDQIKQAIMSYSKDKTLALCKEGVAKKIPPLQLVTQGLTPAIRELGDKFGKGQIALPFLMVGAECMQLGLKFLIGSMPKGSYKPKATMVLGSVAGDIHDLGISIVSAVFEANGIHVIMLGKDVPKEKFIDTAVKEGADIIGTSALLTGTMFQQKVVLEAIKKRGLRDKFIYLVGGGAMPSGQWCQEIGADGWATDVLIGLEVAKQQLLKKKGIEV